MTMTGTKTVRRWIRVSLSRAPAMRTSSVVAVVHLRWGL